MTDRVCRLKPGLCSSAEAGIRQNESRPRAAGRPGGAFTLIELPAHKSARGTPAGGNEVFVDGSARWIKAREMFYLHSWNAGSRQLYFYQDDLGALESLRSSLTKGPS